MAVGQTLLSMEMMQSVNHRLIDILHLDFVDYAAHWLQFADRIRYPR